MFFFHAAGGEAPGLAPWGEGGDPLAIEMPPVKGKKKDLCFIFSSSFPRFHYRCMHVGVFMLSAVKK